MLGMSLSPCSRYHPAGVVRRFSQVPTFHTAFTLRLRARPPGLRLFEATSAFTFVTARRLATTLLVALSIGFRVLVSRHPAIQATELLTFTPAGLTPAEHTSLRWTHNRTFSFPESGFPIIFFLKLSLSSSMGLWSEFGKALKSHRDIHPGRPCTPSFLPGVSASGRSVIFAL